MVCAFIDFAQRMCNLNYLHGCNGVNICIARQRVKGVWKMRHGRSACVRHCNCLFHMRMALFKKKNPSIKHSK